jgi:histidinol-phosphatase (PHP family)
MIPLNDYHMHTPLCGHAVGEPKEYVEQAIKLGFKEMGFSDHAPYVHMVDPKVTMNKDQLPDYYRMIEEVRDQYRDKIKVKIAIEADFIPGYESKTQAILDDYPYDYVIGSVHFIKDWGFDNPSERDQWDESDVNQVYRDYYDLLRQSARSKMYDIVAHADLVKKFGHRATEDMTGEIQKNAQVFKETGMTVEINTSGLRKPAKEIYPALSNLEIYSQAGIPLTFGSDAHDPIDVGKDFAAAVELAKKAGYKEYVLFKNRKIEQSVKI